MSAELMELTASLHPKPVSGYDIEEMDGEVVIYHPATEAIYYCNATAALIFRLCDGTRDIAAIVTMLRQAYPEASSQIESDVHTTIGELSRHGALTLR